MVKVIGVGDCMVDKNLTNGMMYPGGQALNIAVNTKLCGAQSAFIGAFGDDYIADHMKKTMDEIGLDYSHSHFYHAPNAFARYKVIDNDRVFQRSPNGRYNPMQGAIRRMLAYEGFSKEDIEYIKGFDVMHTSNGAFIEEYLPELAAQGINERGRNGKGLPQLLFRPAFLQPYDHDRNAGAADQSAYSGSENLHWHPRQ